MQLLPLALVASFGFSISSISAAPSSYIAPRCGLTPRDQHARDTSPQEGFEDVVVSAWYPGWQGQLWPPSKISWSKYTEMTFAFATTTANGSLALDSISQSVLPTFVSLAKQNNVKALVSIGGWTGSQYFSPAVNSSDSRAAFVKTVVAFAKQYDLDGLDFDWEYPNGNGLTCNAKSPNDSANFLAFLQALRDDPVGKNLTVTAAVGIKPFMGPDQTPMSDVSAFAEVLDHIAIMAYDIYGPWSSTVGPNAPLDDSCATTPVGSVKSAVNAWGGAKFPANRISLGIASYGHAFSVPSSAARGANGQLSINAAIDAASTPSGDIWDSKPGPDPCGEQINHNGGIFNFWGMVDGGFLNQDGTPANGIDYTFDNCSQTPFVYNSTSQVMVSYDNVQSFTAKGHFVNDNGLKGVSMWMVAGDYNDILINAIHDAMDVEQHCS